MTFADEIEKVASVRFSLVRLEPARQIDGIWTDIGGGLFEYEFTELVSRILENGSTLTKVSGTPASGEWSQDEETKTVTVFPVSGSNTIIMFYYLFYTSDVDRLFPVEVTSGSDVCWNGRILTDPSVTQSVNNLANSFTLTSSTSNTTLANQDSDFQKYLTAQDSFANKNARAWVVVNGEVDDTFTGKIVSVNVSENNISINLNDGLNISLQEPAYYGEPIEEAIVTLGTYPDAPISSINKPIPLIFGETNQHKISALRGANTTLNSFLLTDGKYKAINVDKDFDSEWVLCRLPDENDLYSYTFGGTSLPEVITFDTIVNSASSTIGIVCRSSSGITQDDADVEIGDTFTYTTASGTYNAVVINVTPTSRVEFISDNRTDSTPMTVTSVSSVTKNPLLKVEESGNEYILIPGDQYTTTISTQTNTKIVTIDIEANISRALNIENIRLRGISPGPNTQTDSLRMSNRSVIKYRVRTDNVLKNHSDVLKSIIENTGYVTDATSFATAKSDFDANVSFSIPFAGENKIGPLKNYIERILASSIGIMHIDSEGAAHYNLLVSPSAGDTVNEEIYLKGSLQTKLSYRDVATKISWNNQHSFDSAKGFNLGSSQDYPINMILLDPTVTAEDNPAKFLHQTESTDLISHIITDIKLDSRYLKLLELRSERFVNYKYTTSAQSLLKDILDDITISDPRVLGGSGSVNTKITAFTKDDDKVTITVSDLLGL